MKEKIKQSITMLLFYLMVVGTGLGLFVSCESNHRRAGISEENINTNTGNDSYMSGYSTCDPNPCIHAQKNVCIVQESSVYCLCNPGYSENSNGNCIPEGTSTDTPCDPNLCTEANQSRCIVQNEEAFCLCDEGYSKDSEGYCTMDQNFEMPCYPNPCTETNKTVCTLQNGSTDCICDSGYIEDDTESCVLDESPEAVIAFSPSTPNEDESVVFNASGSNDNGTIVSYEWDFDGDDVMDTIGMMTAFVYNTPGTYKIKLIVTDNTGLQGESIQQIVVNPIGTDTTPPVWDNPPGGIMDMVVRTGEITVFWDTATDAENQDVEYLLYWSTDVDELWNVSPMVFTTNEPYTITGLASDTYCFVGVRCRDTAQPPNASDDTASWGVIID